jgi:hypothetical protein
MGGAGVNRPPSLICPRASAWRAALVPFSAWRTLRPDVPRKRIVQEGKANAVRRDQLRMGPKPSREASRFRRVRFTASRTTLRLRLAAWGRGMHWRGLAPEW